MKNIALLILLFCFSVVAKGQDHKPHLLHEPATWQFEQFALPPSFAPAIPYKGVEELRFAPGMFKKDSLDYFTYVFVAELDSLHAISKTEIRDYLLKYYKGLCGVTAKDRKLVIDTAQITATVKKKKGAPAGETAYDAVVNLFGVFADGAPVKLNMEISVIANAAVKKTWLFFVACPRGKKDPIWKELYAIQKKTVLAIHK